MAYNSKYTGAEVENLLGKIDNKQDTISDLDAIRSGAGKGATAVQPSELARVATSGSYNDLSDKPTIPNRLGQLTNDKGFVTTNDIKASVWECPLEGEIGDILEETDDRDNIELLSEWIGELSNQRPCLLMYDDPYSYAFVQNYKSHPTYGSDMCRFSYIYNGYIYEVEYDDVMLPVTLTIVNKTKVESNSGGSSEGGSSAYAEVNHGTSDSTFELTPNTFHVWDEMTALTLTLGAETSGVANEYLFQFTSPATPTSLTLPDGIKFSEDLVIEANKIYQISILKGLGSVLSWDSVVSIFPITLATNTTTDAGKQVYIELEKLGESGELEGGLLYVENAGYVVEITTFAFDSTRNAYRLTFSMTSIFLDSSGYCYVIIID